MFVFKRQLLRVVQTQARFNSTTASEFQYILQSSPAPGVALITLNRPKQLNALFSPLFAELNTCLAKLQEDNSVGAIVLTGSEKAFAAGADIKEMSNKTYEQVAGQDFLAEWGRLTQIRKPILGAVNGFALGGGCELAMMCDILYAGEKATFGQPEIKLGVIPGGGGTQRLLRAAGKSNTMEIILTGRNFTAQEALNWGLVSKICKPEELVDETVKVAAKIAGFGRLSLQLAKEAVNAAAELPLKEGLVFERRLFHGCFATADQKEGMAAFVEKRKPDFSNKA